MTAGELLRSKGWEPIEVDGGARFPLWRKGDIGPMELSAALMLLWEEIRQEVNR